VVFEPLHQGIEALVAAALVQGLQFAALPLEGRLDFVGTDDVHAGAVNPGLVGGDAGGGRQAGQRGLHGPQQAGGGRRGLGIEVRRVVSRLQPGVKWGTQQRSQERGLGLGQLQHEAGRQAGLQVEVHGHVALELGEGFEKH
jgi:hypothetical protein